MTGLRSATFRRFVFFASIGVLVYVLMLAVLIAVEGQANNGSISDWNSALWYSIVTLTTVGYGDFVPVTAVGRVIGFVFLFASISIYGFLIGQIASLMDTMKENKRLGNNGTSFRRHAILIGWDSYAKAVCEQLVGVGKKVAIVTNKTSHIDTIYDSFSRKEVFVLFSDFANLDNLEKANIEEANTVFINMPSDTEKLVYTINFRKEWPQDHLKIIVSLDNSNLKQTFLAAGVTYVMSDQEISSKLLASYIFEPEVAQYSEDILSYANSDDDYDIKQFKVLDDNPYRNQMYIDAFLELKRSTNSILIGLTKVVKGSQYQLLKNPPDETLIQEGDYLIMIINGKAEKLISKQFEIEEGR